MPRRRTRRSFATGIAIVAVLAVATTTLTVLALQSVESAPHQRAVQPAPTFSFGSPAPSPTPTVEQASTAPINRAAQRMFVFGSDPGVAWRAIEGSCAGGITPIIERSADGGVTWADVTPAYRDVRQVLTLEPFAGNQAQAVVVVGDECAVDGLRTFTQGRFWEPYSEVLAQSTYVSPEQESIIITPAGQVTAPCVDPRDIRSANGTLTLICGGDLQRATDGGWTPSGYADVLATARDSDDTPFVAWRSTDCDGITVSRAVDAALTVDGCVLTSQAVGPLALAMAGADAWVWDGDAVTAVEMGG